MARKRFCNKDLCNKDSCNKDLPCDPHRRYASAAVPVHRFVANRTPHSHTEIPQRLQIQQT